MIAFHVATDTFFFLGIGKEHATNDTVVVLSVTNFRETTPIASVAAGANSATIPADGLLIAVASKLLAAFVVQNLSSRSSILLLCSSKDHFLAAALLRRAAAKAVRVTFTCDAKSTDDAQDLA